jgi:hypothetical protein
MPEPTRTSYKEKLQDLAESYSRMNLDYPDHENEEEEEHAGATTSLSIAKLVLHDDTCDDLPYPSHKDLLVGPGSSCGIS